MTLEFILRIFIAAVLGGVIGLEREYRSKVAGFRTHSLVSIGSALFMVISIYGFDTALLQNSDPRISVDLSRVAAGIVSGIGFIGAGAIIFQKNKVHGLTTAAGLWVTAAIGVAVGAGMYILGAASVVIVLTCLELPHLTKKSKGYMAPLNEDDEPENEDTTA